MLLGAKKKVGKNKPVEPVGVENDLPKLVSSSSTSYKGLSYKISVYESIDGDKSKQSATFEILDKKGKTVLLKEVKDI